MLQEEIIISTANSTLNFLSTLDKFYAEADPNAKVSLGHEIEHIMGVMDRGDKAGDAMSSAPEAFGGQTVDKQILLVITALHDIGNVIGRDNHGQTGRGRGPENSGLLSAILQS